MIFSITPTVSPWAMLALMGSIVIVEEFPRVCRSCPCIFAARCSNAGLALQHDWAGMCP